MRFINLLLVFGLVANGASRPSRVENESEVYAEYEEKEPAADEYINDKDKDSQEIETRSETQDEDVRKQALTNNEYENVMERKLYMNKNENMGRAEEMPISGHYKSDSGHDEAEEEADFSQPAPNERFKTYKRNQNNEYRSGDSDVGSNDNNMESNRRIIKDKSDYNNEAIEPRDQPLYKQITYYNKVQGDLFHKKKPNSVFSSNRDRRETVLNQQETLNDDKNIEKKGVENNNEDSVSAIKRNIKKLSREELEDLLNSLSDDKRALLNKIISNKFTNDNVNKREITKKAGAVEENNYLENSRSDLNKLESGSSVDSLSSLSQSETTETTKQSESSEISKTKASESDDNTSPNNEKKDEVNDMNLNNNQESMQDNVALSKDSNGNEKSKNENKREINIEEMTPENPELINEPSNNENYDSDKDANWSELMKDESELHNSNLYKRGVDDYSNTADVKSLEDSFPLYGADNAKSSFSQMAPLIRVKRTNNIKRSINHSSGNMKVPYFPGAANDDDNEKDEFDDGFNFENSYNYEKVGKEDNKNIGYYDISSNRNRQYTKPSRKCETDSAKIGSDTDNVLSNIEGVDDNLMYNKEIRKKRIADDTDANQLQQESLDSAKSFNENNMRDSLSKKDLHYQDQDAIGAIQRGANEELGRYKRIRRLNKSPPQENTQ
ncbi:GATA zinc finger domain-containing protein 14-like [Pieris rapae]|uniref:GATA zinc finger domain-containing protein 14-like n=1 Tax=Pieris rapae TaxID=64459 RepID=UPI001E27A3BC|nr:GATA zinc finger domain-containing protein 14-like [Pieris rapae]